LGLTLTTLISRGGPFDPGDGSSQHQRRGGLAARPGAHCGGPAGSRIHVVAYDFGVKMPKRTDIKSILIIGAGPIVIGQACEFDYSGAQACKALREEGYRVILVNSNPATIMTDPEMADATYIEPITWRSSPRSSRKERPDALLPTMGGQTALNCALDLRATACSKKYGVEMIGATPRRSTRPRTARSSATR
jgi:hypothetical protein